MAARRAPHISSDNASLVGEAAKPPLDEGAATPRLASSNDETNAAQERRALAETRRSKPTRSNEVVSFAVVDTWPADVPIATQEVDVIEAFLGKLLEQILSEDP